MEGHPHLLVSFHTPRIDSPVNPSSIKARIRIRLDISLCMRNPTLAVHGNVILTAVRLSRRNACDDLCAEKPNAH